MNSLKNTTSINRFGVRLFLVAWLATVPWVIQGICRARSEIHDGVHLWLPQRLAETRQYHEFLSRFGSDDMIVISWPGFTLKDKRADRFAEKLRQRSDLFSDVLTGRELIRTLTGSPTHFSRREAHERLRGSFIGPDDRTSGIIVTLTGKASENRSGAVQFLRASSKQCGIPENQIRMGGPAIDSFALEQGAHFTMDVLIGLSGVVGFLLAWISLRSLHLAVLVVTTAAYCAGAGLAIISFTGNQLNLIVLMVPALTYALTISGAVHIINYHRQAQSNLPPRQAAWKAVAMSWKPCLLSFATTSAGMFSLSMSSVEPLRLFGIYSATAVLLCLPMLLVFLPAMLAALPSQHHIEQTDSLSQKLTNQLTDGLLMIGARHRLVTAGALVAIVGCGIGLPQLRTTLRIEDLFFSKSQVIREYRWLEEHLGPLAPVEVIVQFPEASHLSMLKRVQRIRTLQNQLVQLPGVGSGMSIATFVPEITWSKGFAALAKRRILLRNLTESRHIFTKAGLLRSEKGNEFWRISLRIPALGPQAAGTTISAIQKRLQSTLDEFNDREIRAECTGMALLVDASQRALLDDLKASVVMASGLIALSMIIFLKSIPAGLVSMIPNLISVIVVLGTLSWYGCPVGIGTVLASGLSLGVIVDNEIHFLHWFQDGMQQGLTRRDAVRHACRHCCGAMINTTVICGAGLLTFFLGDFIPVAYFGLQMCLLLSMAVVVNLTLLPALLIGGLGKLFEHGSGLYVPWSHFQYTSRKKKREQQSGPFHNHVR